MSVAREAKHRAFVVQRRAKRTAKKFKFDTATVLFEHRQRRRPFVYRPSRYRDTFLARDVPARGASAFPARVFAVWTGDNEMSVNRKRSLAVIADRIELPLELVTPANLERWLVPDHPLPLGFEQLSLVHRSDYLRGYLMHHHGGGYIDVKEPIGSWLVSYEAMEADAEAWAMSYHTVEANWVGKLRGRLGRDIVVNYGLMFGKGSFFMRSYTPLTAAWVEQMEAVLDERQDALLRHPGGMYGADHYPISWTDLLARILDPLTLKYSAHIRYDDRMLLNFEDYR